MAQNIVSLVANSIGVMLRHITVTSKQTRLIWTSWRKRARKRTTKTTPTF